MVVGGDYFLVGLGEVVDGGGVEVGCGVGN